MSAKAETIKSKKVVVAAATTKKFAGYVESVDTKNKTFTVVDVKTERRYTLGTKGYLKQFFKDCETAMSKDIVVTVTGTITDGVPDIDEYED